MTESLLDAPVFILIGFRPPVHGPHILIFSPPHFPRVFILQFPPNDAIHVDKSLAVNGYTVC